MIATVGDITGKNFIVDPRVTGNVTVITSKPMRASQVYDIFLSILKVHDYQLYRAVNAIEHSKIKVSSRQTNGIFERFH